MVLRNTQGNNINSNSNNVTLSSIILDKNLNILRDFFSNSNDFKIRTFTVNDEKKTKGAVIYLEGMVSKELVDQSIIKPLLNTRYKQINLKIIKDSIVSCTEIKTEENINLLIDSILNGYTALLINGTKKFISVDSKGFEKRSVEDPKTEVVVRGPREAFNENIITNIALIRRKIHDSNLVFESIVLGTRSKTDINIAYIKNLANPKLIEEVKVRLNKINIDSILESGYVEQLIEDSPSSIFPTINNTEKPDVIAAKLLEGKVAIITDGTPFVLTVPMTFIESFHNAEDYYAKPYFAGLIRILRYVSFIISVLAPATYVALSSFHQEMIPTPLLISMAEAHEGIPFPAILEAFLMVISFEILQEAGVRLPRPIGQAVSIVGALVIGESAVAAGLIGAPMVIVIALTAISSFIISSQRNSISILRIIYLILGGTMGAFGIIIGVIQTFIHLSALRSFGTPYFSPIAPFKISSLGDVFIRKPLWNQKDRPCDIGISDIRKQGKNTKPTPPKGDDKN